MGNVENIVSPHSNNSNDDLNNISGVKKLLNKHFDDLNHVSNKIKNVYYNENVKNILLNDTYIINQMKKHRENIFEYCDKILLNIKNLVDYWDKKIGVLSKYNDYCRYSNLPYVEKMEHTLPILKDWNKIDYSLINLYSDIMDLYVLRRILDKNYIKNIIVYTGAYHTTNYLLILVKYFDFKVTHCTSNEYTLDELHNMIKQSVKTEELFCKCMPKKFYQCIDMANFPDNFL